MKTTSFIPENKTKKWEKATVLKDYKIACESRQASFLGRREVFMGKAKFGIFGDGKEVAQIALAKVFKRGDWRSGYYRDQTWMLALGEVGLKHFFSQLYAHADLKAEPCTGGRLMNVHYGSRSLDERGQWLNQTQLYNSTTDMSPTSIQMARLLGLGYASKLYRLVPELKAISNKFSRNGDEIAFGSIGDGACAEGIFYETVNAAGVLQVPILISVWDDAYAISVPRAFQTTKEEISKALAGFQRNNKEKGVEILKVKGWDYPALCEVYAYAAGLCRKNHIPVVIHVDELTQPQGHSTSGSHERYKSKERLEWEAEYDCNKKFREWILQQQLATETELKAIEDQAIKDVKKARDEAWNDFTGFIQTDLDSAENFLRRLIAQSDHKVELEEVLNTLKSAINPIRMDILSNVKKALRITRHEVLPVKQRLSEWIMALELENEKRYSSHLYSESVESPLLIKEVKPIYDEKSPIVDGREVINACFDANFSRDPRLFAIGEDVGKIGDVNQGFAGLQQKYGEWRITDTGIRETTIIGQGLGAAHRGLKPIAEIQYLDYVIYGLEPICDDLASVHYRSKGGHKAPLIIRTRGHRLEGVWHSGSPIGMILNCIRGIYFLVPRNMLQAAGFYNVLFRSDNPALVIECLNTYRRKERLPKNIGEFTVPLGVPEILKTGYDLTLVTYGAMCKIVLDAAEQLEQVNISVEVIDVQSLIPFDINHVIVESVKKTNRLIVADEDVPGGASAYILQQIMEVQKAYFYLDSPPETITAKEHRPAYSSDGDYFSKPNIETIIDRVYSLMHETNPNKYPALY